MNKNFSRYKKAYHPAVNTYKPPVKQEEREQNYVMVDFCGCKVPEVNSENYYKEISKSYDINNKYELLTNDIQLKNSKFKLMSNGLKSSLIFTTFQNRMRSYLLDPTTKKPRLICTRFRMDESIYTGSILEGELLFSRKGEWIFLINEIHKLKGKEIKDTLQSDLLNDDYLSDPVLQIAELVINPLLTYQELKQLNFDTLIKKDYQITGFYIYHNSGKKYIYSIYKTEETKEIKEEKVLTLRDTNLPDVYQIYDNDVKKDIAYIPDIKISLILSNYFLNNPDKKEINALCKYSDKFKKWYPVSLHQ